MKILPIVNSYDSLRLQRFKIEAQAAARLQHPNIVQVYSVGYEDGIHYFAMQLVDGYPLSRSVFGRWITRRNGIRMPQPLKIDLDDGSLLEIDQERWKVLASPVYASLQKGAYVTEKLVVQQDQDGRTLVYIFRDRPGPAPLVAGELLPANSDMVAAVRRVAQRFGVTDFAVQSCLRSLTNQFDEQ